MKRQAMKRQSRDKELADLRASLAEEEAYRATLSDGFQARTIDSKIAYWKKRIAELESSKS